MDLICCDLLKCVDICAFVKPSFNIWYKNGGYKNYLACVQIDNTFNFVKKKKKGRMDMFF